MTKSAVFLLPALAAAAAIAAPASATNLHFTSGDITSGSFGDAKIGKGNFTDKISFTLSQIGEFSASLTSTATKLKSGGDLDFSSVKLTGPGGPYSFSITNNGVNGKIDSADFDAILGAGTYLLTITGYSYGNAQFGADTTVTSVPEAASWLMMLGGFALMGAASRRQRRPDLLSA
jgi:hypothetical protein